jgi:hypothetical protein
VIRQVNTRQRGYYRPGEDVRYYEPKCQNNNFTPDVLTDYTLAISGNSKLWALIDDGTIKYDKEVMLGMINNFQL